MAAAMPTTTRVVTSSQVFQRAKNNANAPLPRLHFKYKLKCCSTNLNSNGTDQSLPSTHLPLDQKNINPMTVAGKNMTSGTGKDQSMETQLRIGNGSADRPTIRLTIVRLSDRSTKWVLLTAVLSVLVWRHDSPEVLWAVTGCFLNEGSAIHLKRLINQPRPGSSMDLKRDSEMPSSHAQNLGYVTTYALFILIGWQCLNTFTLGVAFAIIIWALCMAWL